jgi:hypothetical protein
MKKKKHKMERRSKKRKKRSHILVLELQFKNASLDLNS